MLRGAASLAIAAGLLVAAGPASGVSSAGAAAPARAAVTQTKGLVVHVTLDKTRVRIGHGIRVYYTWRDGNGDLVDTNRIGTMAIHVLRNVKCKRTGTSAHPIHGSGSWLYRPQAAFTGAYTHSVKIAVGFNVRTGGCAPIQEKTATGTVTVLPALTG